VSIDRNCKSIRIEAGDGSLFSVGETVKALVQPNLMVTIKVDRVTIVESETEVSGLDIANGKRATVPAYLINALSQEGE